MRIVLYSDIGRELDTSEITEYLAQKLGEVSLEVRDDTFFAHLAPDKISDLAREIAGTKILKASQKIPAGPEPLYGEIEYEKRKILGKTRAFGILYDGFRLRRVLAGIIPGEEQNLEPVQIFFTNRLVATWDDSNRRYHIRTSLYGIPSLISTTGIVEAPAKPREYYLLKSQYERLGKDLAELKACFEGRFIDYGDERLTEITKGYAMQAIFYALTGNPFCEDKGCRLYNAHWQEELIWAQLESGYEFCPRHTEFLNGLHLP